MRPHSASRFSRTRPDVWTCSRRPAPNPTRRRPATTTGALVFYARKKRPPLPELWSGCRTGKHPSGMSPRRPSGACHSPERLVDGRYWRRVVPGAYYRSSCSRPSPSLSVPRRPSPSLSVPRRPSPSLAVPLRPSPSLSVPLRLSPSLAVPAVPRRPVCGPAPHAIVRRRTRARLERRRIRRYQHRRPSVRATNKRLNVRQVAQRLGRSDASPVYGA